MKKHIFLFILMFILMIIPGVLAQPGLQESFFVEKGINIAYPQYDSVPANTSFILYIHAYNLTSGIFLDNSTTNCSLHLYDSEGNHLMQADNLDYDVRDRDWFAEINASNFSKIGEHSYIIQCENDDAGGFVSGILYVTRSGNKMHEAESNFFLVLVAFFAVITIILFAGFVREKKMQYKWTYFIIGFMFLVINLNMVSIFSGDFIISSNVISFLDSITAISFIIMWFLFGLLLVIWFLTALQTILFKKKINKEERFGDLS